MRETVRIKFRICYTYVRNCQRISQNVAKYASILSRCLWHYRDHRNMKVKTIHFVGSIYFGGQPTWDLFENRAYGMVYPKFCKFELEKIMMICWNSYGSGLIFPGVVGNPGFLQRTSPGSSVAHYTA